MTSRDSPNISLSPEPVKNSSKKETRKWSWMENSNSEDEFIPKKSKRKPKWEEEEEREEETGGKSEVVVDSDEEIPGDIYKRKGSPNLKKVRVGKE